MSDTTAQDAIDLDRERLLRGRGPGAGESEVAGHTRERSEVGGIDVPGLLETTAMQAAVTRRDVTALADRVARQRARLAGDLAGIAAEAGSAARTVTGRAAAFGVGVLVGWLLRSRRGWRRTGDPRASRPAPAPRGRRRRPTRST